MKCVLPYVDKTKSNIWNLISFQVDDDHTFGIDWDGPVGTVDPSNPITVPEADAPLQAAIEARLQQTINPLQPSPCFGLDLYVKATREVQVVIGQP